MKSPDDCTCGVAYNRVIKKYNITDDQWYHIEGRGSAACIEDGEQPQKGEVVEINDAYYEVLGIETYPTPDRRSHRKFCLLVQPFKPGAK